MAAESAPNVEHMGDYRVRLALDAVRMVIPSTLPNQDRRELLRKVGEGIEADREDIVVEKMAREVVMELPTTAERPGLD